MLKAKHIEFDWTFDEHSESPCCWRTIGNGYSAYVLIPYEGENDPAKGIGTWNGVAQQRGQSGFASKQEAMEYCERTIRDYAQAAVNKASNFLDIERPK